MSKRKNKVGIVGTGAVGASIAFQLTIQGTCDEILLMDINKKKAESEALDLTHCIEYLDRKVKICAGDYSECSDLDIIVITAALPLLPGQTRLDMMEGAANIIKSIVPPIMESGFKGHFVLITNPVDIMSYYTYKLSGLPKSHVIGTGTALDSARLKNFLAELVGVDTSSVQAYTIGEHGDSQMIPWSNVMVGGKSFYDILEDNKERFADVNLDQILTDVKQAGWEIVKGKGTTNYGIAATTCAIVKAILNDEDKVFPVSTLLEGEYGENGIYTGVPAIINANGVKEIVEIRLTEEEKNAFHKSAEVMKEYIEKLC
ncbi:L-lactate dehydrogenase [Lachnospiraceae bacterium KM106-2]|nr:L-lactate dehydrogenase [Lachnospiraceae bacterium KM106-2]